MILMGLAPYVHMLRREQIRDSGDLGALREFDAKDRAFETRLAAQTRGLFAIAVVIAVVVVCLVWLGDK